MAALRCLFAVRSSDEISATAVSYCQALAGDQEVRVHLKSDVFKI